MGIGDWLSDRKSSVSDWASNLDVPSWAAERYSNVAGAADAARGNMTDVAKWALAPEVGVAQWVGRQAPGMPDFGGGGGGGGGQAAAAAPAANDTNKSKDITWSPLVNPLQMNMLYSQHIAPLMAEMDKRFMENTGKANSAANAQLERFPMPAQFQSFFANTNAQRAQDQLNL